MQGDDSSWRKPCLTARRKGPTFDPGDVLTRYDGADVTEYQQLKQLIRQAEVGDAVDVEILRGHERMTKAPVILKSQREIESAAAR